MGMSDAEMRVAMFGGTFNPVHNAHLRAAVELRDAFELDALHMIPAHLPPHRGEPGVSSRDRLEMLRKGVGDTPGLVVDDREIRRDGPSWSVETLASLRREYGDRARLFMILGRDAFLRLHRWHCPEALFEHAHILVIGRPESDARVGPELTALIEGRVIREQARLMARPAGGIFFHEGTTAMAISATAIRRRLSQGGCVSYLMPAEVERFIACHGFYRESEGAGGG